MSTINRFVPTALLALVIAMCIATTAAAQTGAGRLALGGHGGLSKYWGTFTDNQYWFGGDLFARYNILPFLSLHAQFGLAQLRYKVNQQNLLDHPEYFGPAESNVYPGTSIRREDINTIRTLSYAGILSFNLAPDEKFVPYIFAGLGLLDFEPRNLNQNVGLPNNQAHVYDKRRLFAPIGMGAELYVTDNLALNAKAQVNITGTDYLDDFAEPGTANDIFATFGVGISYYVTGSLDCDKDGLSDEEEKRLGTDPCNADTDNDGLSDGDEVHRYGTDPLHADTDGDGLTDADEVLKYHTDPRIADTDNDGLSDGQEIARGTDPHNPDTDGDGLTDGDEVNKYSTDPTNRDTDGDGLSDGDEVTKYGTNPKAVDTDGDGLSDGDEVNTYHTNPLVTDTDGDGLSDGDEVKQYHTNPTNRDTDGDKLSDGEEVMRTKTDPNNPDTDGDGVIDGDDLCPLIPGVKERGGCPAPPKIGTITNFPAVYFIVNTDEFDFSRPETDESLTKMLAYIRQCPGLGVVVEGHASREGTEKRNQTLSDMRANKVKVWLLEHGADASKVEATIGYGSRMNAVAEPDPKSAEARRMDPSTLESIRKQNRRIAVKVVRTCD